MVLMEFQANKEKETTMEVLELLDILGLLDQEETKVNKASGGCKEIGVRLAFQGKWDPRVIKATWALMEQEALMEHLETEVSKETRGKEALQEATQAPLEHLEYQEKVDKMVPLESQGLRERKEIEVSLD